MSGFQSKRQASKSLLEPQSAKEVANEQSWDTGLWFVATTASEAHLQAALQRLASAVEGTHPDPWKDAIDAELVCLHLGTVDSFPTADQALEALIDWHVQVALDPEVSSAAQAMVDRGATQPQAEPVAWQWLNSAVYRKKLPKFAEAGAWNPLYAAPQAQPAPNLKHCACEFDGDTCVSQCKLHGAHVDAIHEWAERAKAAEAKLATQPAVAEPLTDGELRECFTGTNTAEPLSEGWPGLERFARAVEQAHGIKGSAA